MSDVTITPGSGTIGVTDYTVTVNSNSSVVEVEVWAGTSSNPKQQRINYGSSTASGSNKVWTATTKLNGAYTLISAWGYSSDYAAQDTRTRSFTAPLQEITFTSFPCSFIVEQGENLPLSGILTSLNNITKITVNVEFQDGVCDDTKFPNSKSYDLSGLELKTSTLPVGSYTIRVWADHGTKKGDLIATAMLTVKPTGSKLDRIEANPTLLLGIGDKASIAVRAIFADNSTDDVSLLAKYTVSNGSVIKVEGNEVTALTSGNSRITVEYERKNDSYRRKGFRI